MKFTAMTQRLRQKLLLRLKGSGIIVGGTSMAGGKGGAIKTVWGVLLMNIVYNAMTMFSIPAALQPFVKGLILLVVIVQAQILYSVLLNLIENFLFS